MRDIVTKIDDVIIARKKNEVFLELFADQGLLRELSDFFTFEVPGAKFMPQYRNKVWDGKIRLFNNKDHTLYYGLIHHIDRFCKEREYTLKLDDSIEAADNWSLRDTIEFEKELQLPFKARDYQREAFTYAVRNRRGVLVSPTASGKSLIIYMLAQHFAVKPGGKILIIVPTTSLVYQMAKDFNDYGFDQDCHCITAGVDKDATEQVTISTWQSIYKMPKSYFEQFDVVVGDEAHLFKAKSLTSIMTKLISCKYRFGLTGTLDGAQTHKLVLEGLFGPVKQVVKTKELIDSKQLADFKIKAIVLKHPSEDCKALKDAKYQDEVDWIVRNEERNKFLANLSLSLKGNTLLLFQFVEKHGKVLEEMIRSRAEEGRKIFYVYGGTDADTRESVRAITEKEEDAIIVASYGTFSTGINIKRLHNIIFSSPTKSRIRTLQSIGRGLRKGGGNEAEGIKDKQQATLFDIADDITWKTRANYTLKHFAERIKIYNQEKFDYKIYKVKLNGTANQTNTVY